MSDQNRQHARSFGAVADDYDRARPSYPTEAVEYLVGRAGGAPKRILELGAGTGKFTELALAAGHEVIATDPVPEMLARLTARAPGATTILASAENIPVPSGSIDIVVSAQAFHWFDHEAALAEIARVLRPGGTIALVWNTRDEAIPWVKKLGRIIGTGDSRDDLAAPLHDCPWFGEVGEREYRFWQDLRRPELFDLVRSRSFVAVLDETDRDEVLERVGALYDDYGRGPDGMKLPYLTRCYKAVLVNQPPPPVVPARIEDDAIALIDSAEQPATAPGTDPAAGDVDPDATQAIDRPAPARPTPSGPEDTGTLLIDFK